MGWCSHCEDDCPVIRDPDKGYICCALCGRILDQDVYFTGPSFTKDGSGQSRLTGSIMQSVQSGYSASHERTLMKGRDEISYIVSSLGVGGGDSIINKAHAFYQIAVGKNFTKGRRTTHVAAACLYIACRQTDKAYLLIDFSDYLQINVYVLGAVFLQLCKTLNLAEHPFVQKLVDPSLFIHRFTERLLGRKNNAVSETALRIVASMKRDWMQTGRKPSGLCGAAIYIAALSHGLSYTKSDVVTVVHVCEATLTKRLIEFENTESGSLTIEEFLARADELDAGSESSQLPRSGKVLCEHKDDNVTHFAHGLCEKCYTEFLKVSGGLDGGAEPPAFQRAEKQRMLKTKEEENRKESTQDTHQSDKGQESSYMQKQSSSDMAQDDVMNGSNMEREGHEPVKTSVAPEKEDLVGTTDDESERLSDIDDREVEGYLHNEEEKKFKKIIWEEMNKEYLEEQAAKAAAAANSTTVNSIKSRKERKQKCGEDKMSDPAQTPLEATRRMLKKKGFSSRVNYEALEDLYSADQGSAKKQKVESDAADRVVEDDQTTHPRVTEDGGDETGGAYDDNNYGELSYDGYDGNGYEDYSYDDYDFS